MPSAIPAPSQVGSRASLSTRGPSCIALLSDVAPPQVDVGPAADLPPDFFEQAGAATPPQPPASAAEGGSILDGGTAGEEDKPGQLPKVCCHCSPVYMLDQVSSCLIRLHR